MNKNENDDTDDLCSIGDCDNPAAYAWDVTLPDEDSDGEYVDKGTDEKFGHEFGIVEWTGEYEEVTFYECEEHYAKGDDNET